MKFYKPFTHPIDKKKEWSEYRWNKMNNLAEINWNTVSLKEKYGRMDYNFFWWVSELLEETMDDYERMSEESCMYCNKYRKQYWTHKDSWLIHLCLPCLILDKVTILLEKIITWRRWLDEIFRRMITILCIEIILFIIWWDIEIYLLTVS